MTDRRQLMWFEYEKEGSEAPKRGVIFYGVGFSRGKIGLARSNSPEPAQPATAQGDSQ